MLSFNFCLIELLRSALTIVHIDVSYIDPYNLRAEYCWKNNRRAIYKADLYMF